MDLYEGIAAPVIPDERRGKWFYNPENGTLHRRKYKELDTIGDIRVTYYVPKDFRDG